MGFRLVKTTLGVDRLFENQKRKLRPTKSDDRLERVVSLDRGGKTMSAPGARASFWIDGLSYALLGSLLGLLTIGGGAWSWRFFVKSSATVSTAPERPRDRASEETAEPSSDPDSVPESEEPERELVSAENEVSENDEPHYVDDYDFGVIEEDEYELDFEPKSAPEDETEIELKIESVEPKKTAKTEEVFVPDDYETLADALAHIGPGGVVVLLPQKKGLELGTSEEPFPDGRAGVFVRFPVVVRGETGRPEDVVLNVPRDGGIWVDLGDSKTPVLFDGVSFRFKTSRKLGGASVSRVAIERGGAEFVRCAFRGAPRDNRVGVSLTGARASVKCANCEFADFGGDALFVGESAAASVAQCRFFDGNGAAIWADRQSKINVVDSVFERNEIAVRGGTGVAGAIRNCEFYGNRETWVFDEQLNAIKLALVGNKEETKRKRTGSDSSKESE